MAQSRGMCPQVVWQHSSSAQIAVRDKENRVKFYFNLVYELCNDNKPCPLTQEPPPPPRETIIQKKIGFVAPIVVCAEISKTINMLSKHGTFNFIPQFRNMVLS